MRQKGNVLFLILLAIILFVALAQAVMHSLRGGGRDISDEQAQSYAAAITQYGALTANTVGRLMLVNDCKDNEISFQNDVVGNYTNTMTPPGNRCKVFHPAGGGMAWPEVNRQWLDPYFTKSPWNGGFSYGQVYFPPVMSFEGVGGYIYTESGRDDVNLQYVDLYFSIAFVNDAVCKAINVGLGLPYPLYAVKTVDTLQIERYISATTKFRGYYTSCHPEGCNYSASLADSSGQKVVSQNFCVTGYWGTGTPESGRLVNTYVHTLIAR